MHRSGLPDSCCRSNNVQQRCHLMMAWQYSLLLSTFSIVIGTNRTAHTWYMQFTEPLVSHIPMRSRLIFTTERQKGFPRSVARNQET